MKWHLSVRGKRWIVLGVLVLAALAAYRIGEAAPQDNIGHRLHLGNPYQAAYLYVYPEAGHDWHGIVYTCHTRHAARISGPYPARWRQTLPANCPVVRLYSATTYFDAAIAAAPTRHASRTPGLMQLRQDAPDTTIKVTARLSNVTCLLDTYCAAGVSAKYNGRYVGGVFFGWRLREGQQTTLYGELHGRQLTGLHR